MKSFHFFWSVKIQLNIISRHITDLKMNFWDSKKHTHIKMWNTTFWSSIKVLKYIKVFHFSFCLFFFSLLDSYFIWTQTYSSEVGGKNFPLLSQFCAQYLITVLIYFNLPQILKALFKEIASRLSAGILVAYTGEKKDLFLDGLCLIQIHYFWSACMILKSVKASSSAII